VDRLFHHEHEKKEHESRQNAQGKGIPEKKSEIDKIEDYLKEDEELEQEGRTYGGLM
jgi:hypothetical protein